MKRQLPLTSLCLVTLFHCAAGQTYQVNGAGAGSNSANGGRASAEQSSQSGSNLGWGSGIEVARQARAAQDAIDRGDYKGGVAFAQRAAEAAPQNAELWFLLGYAARLAEQYQVSVGAFTHGLRIKPNSLRGISGLAQTYAKMGNDAEAERLLHQVISANPKDVNSLDIAGELMLNSDPQGALELLKRADALQVSARTELLIARAYARTGNKDEAKRYLQLARGHGPKNPEVLRAVADEYRDQGQYQQAIATLQSIPSRSNDTEAELAYTYQLAGNQEEAA
ncbi:MAG TPA: tetratricopeptide repeat protein, partial [Candidatus Sulfotelmatobacter sp.]|nr:tetratricopeptide repeat protein [Candidatus Sulfotelmatobacter sp.]